jgi:putative FmdB family regulatory protein
MPVYEYRCIGCGHQFEKLLFSQRATVCCPGCGQADVVRRPSVFGMSGVEKQTSSSSASCSSCSASSCAGCGSR